MNLRQVLPIVLIISALLIACSSQPLAPANAPLGVAVSIESGGTYTNVSAAQMKEILKDKDFFFVNTHIPYAGEIEQTDAHIPYNETRQRLSEYPADKAAKIVVYCRSGNMSATTAQKLVKAGYTNVWNFEGGMVAWQEAGLPLKD